MGWLSRLAGYTDHLTLDVLMNFDLQSGQGSAGLRWSAVRPNLSLSNEQCRIALVALLYARTLVNHEETRAELFDRAAQAARRVLEGDGKLTFGPWQLRVAGRNFSIWPWRLAEPEQIADAKTYTATLQSTARRSLDIYLKMAFGQERVLAPSSALIGAYGLASTLADEARARFARVLLTINAHYRSADKIRLASESAALAAAMPFLQAEELSPRD